MFGFSKKKKKPAPGNPAEGKILVSSDTSAEEILTVEPVEQPKKIRLLFPSDKPILRKASFFVKIALILIAAVLLVVSVKLVMDYSGMLEEEAQKRAYYAELQDDIEELQYYIDAPMDEYYVRKFAWEIFHLVPSDKKVVIVPPNE